MAQQQTSPANAFFQTHKDLFQYEKYVGNQDPFEGDHTAKSFLDQYREIGHDRQCVPALSEHHFALLHPPTRTYPTVNLAVDMIPEVQQPGFVTLQSTASILKIREFPSHPTQLPTRTVGVMQEDTQQRQYPSPSRVPASIAKVDTSGRFNLHQHQRSPVRLSVDPKHKTFSLPNLNDLLIDREARAAATANKTWDEARKIEVLVGNKCVGRVRAASRNFPPSIRSRLHASANVSVRRERLYNLLRRDYEEMSKYCT